MGHGDATAKACRPNLFPCRKRIENLPRLKAEGAGGDVGNQGQDLTLVRRRRTGRNGGQIQNF
jgi:hypothetical protein